MNASTKTYFANIEHDRADLRVPGAFSYGLLEVGTCESGARHKVDVLLGVKAHLL